MPVGTQLVYVGRAVEYLYFPTTSVASVFVDLPSGASAEVALIGADGVTGALAALCGTSGLCRTVVEQPGEAYRVRLAVINEEIRTGSGTLNWVLTRHTAVCSLQAAILALCNRRHALQLRLARALLMRADLLSEGPMLLTQELLADVLGARRSGVAETIDTLRRARVIRWNRGSCTLVDRRELERRTCECYELMKSHTQQLIVPTLATASQDSPFC